MWLTVRESITSLGCTLPAIGARPNRCATRPLGSALCAYLGVLNQFRVRTPNQPLRVRLIADAAGVKTLSYRGND